MTHSISTCFAESPQFISYLTAGDGGLDNSLTYLRALIAGGVDILEVGVPFSDPIADGPVIQQAMQRALGNGTHLFDVLELVQELRRHTDAPVVLFSYYNPILAATRQGFYQRAKASGVDALLVVDLPPEEAADLTHACHEAGLEPIYVITPSTSLARVTDIDRQAQGFLYYACRKGTTGIRSALPAGFADHMTQIKSSAQKPVVAGFGISDRDTAAAVLAHADGFVVGSRFVKAIADGATPAEVTALARSIDPR